MKVAPIAKATVPVVLGVMIAGFLMFHARDVGVVDQARRGFDV